jgi:hypothetical protein
VTLAAFYPREVFGASAVAYSLPDNLAGSTAMIEVDIAEAMQKYGIDVEWKAKSL